MDITFLQGNVGTKHELRTVGERQTKVINFTMASDRPGQDKPEWIDCVAFQKTAEVINQYVDKGREIAVVGYTRKRPYKDSAGNDKLAVELVVNELYLDTAELVIVKGRLGETPELRSANSGKSVCNFALAVDRRNREKPEWYRCTAFDKTAELVCQYMDKGRSMTVVGRMETRPYTKDGETRYSTELIAGAVKFGPKKKDEDRAPQQAAPQQQPAQEPQSAPAPAAADDDFDFDF